MDESPSGSANTVILNSYIIILSSPNLTVGVGREMMEKDQRRNDGRAWE